MAQQALLDGPRPTGIGEMGFGIDHRPGINPAQWDLVNVYAWPVADGPAPITLAPATEQDAWQTTGGDSIFRRDRLSEWFALSGTFEEYPRLHSEDWVFRTKEENCSLLSLINYQAGAGIVVNLNAYGAALENDLVLSTDFGDTDNERKFTLNVYANGKAFLSRGGFVDPATLEKLAEGWIVPNRWGGIQGKWVRIYILPHGRNRLLISSSAGNGFVWEDPTISREDPPDPSKARANSVYAKSVTAADIAAPLPPPVTRAAPVKHTIPKPSLFQPMPIRYAAQGALHANDPSLFSYPYSPGAGASVIGFTTLHDLLPPLRDTDILAGGGDLQVDSNGRAYQLPTVILSRPTDANGGSRNNQQLTPVLYRVQAVAPPTNSPGDLAGIDLAADLAHFSHRHDKLSVTGTVRFRYAENHADYVRAFNIPFNFIEDDNERVRGYLADPKLIVDNNVQFLEWQLCDWSKDFETTLLGSLGRLDGLAISEAMKKILVACGLPDDGSLWEIDDTPAVSGNIIHKLSKGNADDDPTNLPDVVQSAAEWIKYLVDQTSSEEPPFRWIAGWRPIYDRDTGLFKYKFIFKDPANLSVVPVKTLFPSHVTAVAGGSSWSQSYLSVTEGQWQETAIEPEANDIWVWGLDENDKPLVAHKYDAASQDATTALADRPSNWVGKAKQWVEINSSLNTQALVNAYCSILYKRISRARLRAEFRAQWEPSLLEYDTVRIYRTATYPGTAGTDYDDWKVTGYSVDHLRDGAPGISVRPATYYVERWLD